MIWQFDTVIDIFCVIVNAKDSLVGYSDLRLCIKLLTINGMGEEGSRGVGAVWCRW